MSASVAIRFNAATQDAEKAFTGLTRTVAGFEKTFAGVASSVQGHQQRINQAFEQFSGDKLIREASELARAIEKVGGASKLTATEQQNVNRVVTEAIAKYQALGQTAPQHLINLANATKQLEQPTTLASRAMGVLGSAFGQFTLANLAASAISNVVGKLGEFVAAGAKLPGLEQSFNRLAKTVGESSNSILSSMQGATRGLVADIDLMQSANKALLLGLPVTAQEMGELAKTATVLGKAMGLDATQSLNDLITALGRSSPLILDNLGLTVKVGEANEVYAQKLGKAANALTDAEQKMAFYEAAMESARRKTEELGEQSLTLGDLVDKAWVAIGNAVTGAASDINIAIGKALTRKDEFIQFLRDAQQFGIGQAISLGAARPSLATPRVDPVAEFQRQMERDLALYEEQRTALSRLEQAAKNASAPLAALTEKQRELAVQFGRGGESAKEIAERLNAVKETAGVSEKQIQALLERMRTGTKDTDQYRNAVKALADQLSGTALTGEVRKLSDAFRTLTSEQRQTPDVLKRVADAALELYRAGATLTPELFNVVIETGKLSELLPAVKLGLDGTAGAFQVVTGSVKESAARMIEFIDIMNSLKAVPGVPGQLPGFQIPVPQIPEPLPPTFWQKFLGVDGGSFTQAARFAADSAIGALANAITTGDWGTFKASLRDTFANFAGSAIAAGVNLLVPGLGTLLQPLFSALSNAFIGLFDRNRGRDLVENFADTFDTAARGSGFDELHLKLNELGAEGERLWIKLTQGVGRNNPDQARKAIEEVTAALEAQKRKQQEAGNSAVETSKKIQEAQSAATAKIRAHIDSLNSEYNRLFDMVKDEVPEFDDLGNPLGMGVDEARIRGQLSRLDDERKNAQRELDEQMQETAKTFTDLIDEGLQKAAENFGKVIGGIRMPASPTSPAVGSFDELQPGFGGGNRIVPEFNTGTSAFAFVPTSSLPRSEPGVSTSYTILDGRTIAEATVPWIPGAATEIYGVS